ncbi:MAG: DNA primase, partial [Oscillospiraceae bacterium]|nr:DNA primase [Oscillospiraceae bacterium]
MPFPEGFLEELSARNDIVDVVSGYVQLTKRSGSNQFGLCPFHSEKTPSFSVNAERQIYHCFGCGKGGGVINFIMEIENLSFPDAVQFLARRAGMEVPEEGGGETRGRRTRMLEPNREAARFFYSSLMSPGGRAAQDYVSRRGIAPMVKPFGLGFAPDSWDSLIRAMESRGYHQAELIEAGLARPGKKGGSYDYFRNRLMFPVIDVRGSVIGFSGRILGDGEPKYLNSPDTLVYSKSRSLFALNLAKKSKCGYILLAEGNIDVVSLHQAGFDCAVASLGTSLTPDQARLLARYTTQVVLAYDSDAAGKKAAQRAIQLLQPLDIKVKVLSIPDAKDPDEFIQTKGSQAFRELIERSGNQIEYRLEQTAADFDLRTDEGRVGFLREAAKLVASLPGSVEREIYGMRAAEKAGVSLAAFQGEVERVRKKNAAGEKKRETREATAPLRSAQPRSRELRFRNVRSAVAEKGVLNLLYRFPERFADMPLAGEDFSSEVLGRLYDAMRNRLRAGQSVSVAALGEKFTPEELSLLAEIIHRDDLPPAAAGEAMDDYI